MTKTTKYTNSSIRAMHYSLLLDHLERNYYGSLHAVR